ncbi:MAG: hypothetical protein KAS85_08895 [Rhodobacteraceae bacterium]|nr:hypothetical protein [Paracoccaceae bacterium]
MSISLSNNRAEAERNLDNYARTIRKDSETYEQAYARAMGTDLGRSMIKILDDTVAHQTGAPTSEDIAKARRTLMGGH